MKSTRIFALGAVAAALALVPAAHAAWQVDAAHTEVNFSINHFFTPVTGSFGAFDIDLAYDAESPENSSVTATIDVSSIDTGNDQRNGHLRSPDFFDAEKFPNITFASKSAAATEEGLVFTGDLTIRDVTKEIELPVKLLGTKEIPEEMQAGLGGSKRVAGFAASTTLDRNAYGVGAGNWAATLVIAGDVNVEILLEAHDR